MQYTQEFVEQFFANNGCTFLSTYINVKTPVEYIAKCGHKTESCSFEAVRRPTCSFLCKKCSPKISYSEDEISSTVEERGCKFIELWKEKSSNGRLHKMIKIICKCGHEHTLTFEKFQQGEGNICPKCSKPRGKRHANYNPNLTDEERLKNRDVLNQ